MLIFISDLLSCFIFVFIINFLNDASASIQVVVTAFIIIVIYKYRFLANLGRIESLQGAQSAGINSPWLIICRLQFINLNVSGKLIPWIHQVDVRGTDFGADRFLSACPWSRL